MDLDVPHMLALPILPPSTPSKVKVNEKSNDWVCIRTLPPNWHDPSSVLDEATVLESTT